MDRELSPAAIVILVMVVVAAIIGAYFLVAAARHGDSPASAQPDARSSATGCPRADAGGPLTTGVDRLCLLGTNWRLVSGTEALDAA
jgi:hypothetical protein